MNAQEIIRFYSRMYGYDIRVLTRIATKILQQQKHESSQPTGGIRQTKR